MLRLKDMLRLRWKSPVSSASRKSSALPNLKKPLNHFEASDFLVFLSHVQRSSGDKALCLALLAELNGEKAWFDMAFVGDLSASAMQRGVKDSHSFVLLFTETYAESWFCLLELSTALYYDKEIHLVVCEECDASTLSKAFDAIAAKLNLYCGLDKAQSNIGGFNSFSPYFDKTPELWTGNKIRGRFVSQIEYNSRSPLSSARELFKRTSTKPFVYPEEGDFHAMVVFDQAIAADRAWAIRLLCAQQGVNVKLISSVGDFVSGLPMIIFCTTDLLKDPIADSVMMEFSSQPARWVLIHEGDGRRPGGLDGEEMRFWDSVFGSKFDIFRSKVFTSLSFSTSSRTWQYSSTFISRLLDFLGMIKPPFRAKQDTLVFPQEPKVESKEVSEWFANQNDEGIAQKVLLLNKPNSLATIPQERIKALVSCEKEDSDKGVLLSLASQLFSNIPGYFESLFSDAVYLETISGSNDLEELCDILLVQPLQSCTGLLFFDGKVASVIVGLKSLPLVSALRTTADLLPAGFGFVIITEHDDVIRSNWGLRTVDHPLSQVARSLGPQKEEVGDKAIRHFCILYVPGEGNNAARCLAADLVKMGYRVWHDGNRAKLRVDQAIPGIAVSQVVIGIVTESFFTNHLISVELSIAEKQRKKVVFINETDPVHSGGADLVQNTGLILRRMGRPRAQFLQALLAATRIPGEFSGAIDSSDLASDQDPEASLVFTGDLEYTLDSYYDLSASLFSFGISSRFGMSGGMLNGGALVVYLTKNALSHNHVAELFEECVEEDKLVVPIHDSDLNREHTVLNSKSAFDAEGLKRKAANEKTTRILDISSLARTRNSRRAGPERDAYLNALLGRLRMDAALGGLITSRHHNPFRIAIEKCTEYHPGTREWLFSRVATWIDDSQSSNGVFVLIATAGVGKSVVMAELARRGNKHLASLVGGESFTSGRFPTTVMHFFRGSDSMEKSIFTACFSIAQQLRAIIPDFRVPTKEETKTMTPEDVFKRTILDPCATIQRSSKVIILLDALDECDESGHLVASIRAHWGSTRPSWLLLVTASRPEDIISKQSADFNPFVLKPTDENNKEDMRLYLEPRLLLWGCSPRVLSAVFESLFKQSEGVFIWIKFVEQTIQELGYSKEGITVQSVQQIPSGMDNVYKKYFSSLFARLGSQEDFYHDVVALALLASRDLIPEKVWRAALGFGYTLSEEERFSKLVAEPASTLLLFETLDDAASNGERVLKAPHKSMLDWLDKGASAMQMMHLAVKVETRHHASIGNVLDQIFIDEALVCVKPWETLDECQPTLSMLFAISHSCYHLTQAGELKRACEYFLNLDYLFRVVDQARRASRFERVLEDGEQLLDRMHKSDGEWSRLNFILSVLRLARRALMFDPRELAGQILGRLKVGSLNREHMFWEEQAYSWIQRASTQGKLRIAYPPSSGRSGLRPAGIGLVRTFQHLDPVYAVAVSPDGQHLLSGSSGQKAFLWEVNSGRLIHMLLGHTGVIWAVAFACGGTHAITGSEDSSVRIWDLPGKKPIHTLSGHSMTVYAVGISPDDRYVVSGSMDKTVRVWDHETGRFIRALNHTGEVLAVSFSVNGELLATGSRDCIACVWKFDSGERLHTLSWHSNQVYCVAFSPIGNYLVTGSDDSQACIWDMSSSKSLEKPVHVVDHPGQIYGVKVSPDGKIMASVSSDECVCIWDVQSGALIKKLTGGHRKALSAVSFVSNDVLCTAAWDGTVCTWDWRTAQAVAQLESHSDLVMSTAVSASLGHILTGSEDKSAALWDFKTGALLQRFNGHSDKVTCVAFLPDGKRMVTGSADSSIRLWGEDGSMIRTFTGHSDWILVLAVSPKGDFIVSGSKDRVTCIWKVSDGSCIRLTNHAHPVIALAISQCGRLLLTGSRDRKACLFELETGSCIQTFLGHSNEVCAVGISRNCDRVVTGSRDCIARVWDVTAGQCLFQFRHASAVLFLSISNDSLSICCGERNGAVTYWSLQSGEKVDSLEPSLFDSSPIESTESGNVRLGDVGFTLDEPKMGIVRKGPTVLVESNAAYQCWSLYDGV